MGFSSKNFDNLMVSYLSSEEKGRLAKALSQFHNVQTGERINYSDFYLSSLGHDYFQQGDLLREIRRANWNKETASYEKNYSTCLVVSNTCDLSSENKRDVLKEALFAPTIQLNKYLEVLTQNGFDAEQVKKIEDGIKCQTYSNVFYLPPNNNDRNDYVVLFDQIFWLPTEELNSYLEDDINETRICSLHTFGHYLFLVKLSYHFCRVPEDGDRTKFESKESTEATELVAEVKDNFDKNEKKSEAQKMIEIGFFQRLKNYFKN